jgi:hypothetical protein
MASSPPSLPEPEPEPEPEPAATVHDTDAARNAAFGALLDELLAVRARCDARIEAAVEKHLMAIRTQSQIRQWVRGHSFRQCASLARLDKPGSALTQAAAAAAAAAASRAGSRRLR